MGNEEEKEKREVTIDINTLETVGFEVLPNDNVKLIVIEGDEGIS